MLLKPRSLLWLSLLIVALLGIEVTRRAGATLTCYVNLRYESVLLFEPRSKMWQECLERHLAFPFHF